MYKFHTNHMLKVYGSKAKLLFTDTDSLTYELKTNDAYVDMLKHADMYDTSDYPESHPNFSRVNAKVLGKFKNECAGIVPLEFVGLKAKMYSILLPGNHTKKTAKGVKRGFVDKKIPHAHFKKLC